MAATNKKKSSPINEPVVVYSDTRKAHPWFDQLAGDLIRDAVLERREVEAAKQRPLSERRRKALVAQREKLQRKLNPLEVRRDRIDARLRADWGHTGVSEFESERGNLLVSVSMSLTLDPNKLRRKLQSHWRRITAQILQPAALLALGDKDAAIRDVLPKAIGVTNLKVAITPPSSRRPKSGTVPAEVKDAA